MHGKRNREAVGTVPTVTPIVETVTDAPSDLSKRVIYNSIGFTDFKGLYIAKDDPNTLVFFDTDCEAPRLEKSKKAAKTPEVSSVLAITDLNSFQGVTMPPAMVDLGLGEDLIEDKSGTFVVKAMVHKPEDFVPDPANGFNDLKQEKFCSTDGLSDIKVEEDLTEQDLISGILQTSLVRGRVHMTVLVGSVSIDALFDPGSTRTFIRKHLGERVLDLLSKKLDCSRESVMIVANGVREKIEGRAMLPLMINGVTRDIEVAIVENLNTEMVFGLDAQEEFDMTFAARTKKIWMPDTKGEPNPLLIRIIEDYACSGIVELQDWERAELERFLKEKLPPKVQNAGPLRATHLVKHNIDVQGHPPIKERYRVLSPKVKEAMYTELDRLLAEGIVKGSHSEWSAPIMMVKKADGKYRFCIDFRKLNAISKKDAYPLPNMIDILSQLHSAKYISKIDLNSAFNQIPLEESCQEYTAFTVPGRGLFQYVRMPFGLTGAPATFQRLIDRIITPDMRPNVFCYIDDIIIVTETFEEHLDWLGKVLIKIEDAGFTINAEKSDFCCTEVRYLGFVVNREGLQPDPKKVEPILSYPVPRNVKQLRRFIGLASWYRRFIPEFARMAEPLTRLFRTTIYWHWDLEQQEAFDWLKTVLTTAPVLAYPSFKDITENPFNLQTDASATDLGVVLTQNQSGHERVIAYASRTLTSAERNYTVTERECLAVVWGIRKFREFLEGFHFKVITDHSSLKWLHNLRNPTGRLARWSLELLEYDFEIIHRKGALHHVPDALSRISEDQEFSTSAVSMIDLNAEVENSEIKDKWYLKRMGAVISRPKIFCGLESGEG